MCVMSMVMDHFHDKWKDMYPNYPYHPGGLGQPIFPPGQQNPQVLPGVPAISAAEIAEFRKLLDRAREYDKKHNQPDCELEEKRQRLLALAKELGIDISFVEAPAS